MTRHDGRLGRWAIPVALAAACALLAVGASRDPRWHGLLDYRRGRIADGDGWRLVTGHLMHWSGSHAALDVAALLLVAWIFGPTIGFRRQATVCVAAVIVVDAALWTLHPSLERYVGLSALLHAWFSAGAVVWASGQYRQWHALDPDERRSSRLWGLALLIALAVKLAVEASDRAFWLVGADFPVATAAHRWGAVAGVACGLAFVRFSRPAAADVAAGASRGR